MMSEQADNINNDDGLDPGSLQPGTLQINLDSANVLKDGSELPNEDEDGLN